MLKASHIAGAAGAFWIAALAIGPIVPPSPPCGRGCEPAPPVNVWAKAPAPHVVNNWGTCNKDCAKLLARLEKQASPTPHITINNYWTVKRPKRHH